MSSRYGIVYSWKNGSSDRSGRYRPIRRVIVFLPAFGAAGGAAGPGGGGPGGALGGGGGGGRASAGGAWGRPWAGAGAGPSGRASEGSRPSVHPRGGLPLRDPHREGLEPRPLRRPEGHRVGEGGRVVPL